ncbi:glycosyltransferase family 4 protein [Sphingomicrobium sp. XHP0239]|uniref:glycosyltransferase family 4 protein n=1 Tax=Sphingomicrobium maritimum TaxID=3133972 RepID=UPI0031CCCE9A
MAERVVVIASDARSFLNFRSPLLLRFRDLGLDVTCLAPDLSRHDDVGAVLTGHGIAVEPLDLDRTGLNPLSDARGFFKLVATLRRIGAQHLLAYTIKPVVYGMLAGWLARIPRRTALITGLGYAFTGEATGRRGAVQRVARRLYRAALARASAIIFQNPDDAALFASMNLLPAKVPVTVVSGSGVDLSHYPPQPLPGGPLQFLMISRLLSAKGVREYARAAAMLKSEGHDARFLLVGARDSNPDAVSREEAESWNAHGALEWLGPSDDVRPHLANCHVYVLPSYREGTPRSTLEAMATGRAVVTTDAPGCRETVRPGVNGSMVPVGNAAALAQAMRELIENPERIERMGAASLDYARERFDVTKVNEAMVDAMELNRER